jgi:hypothetical protein
MDRFSVTRFAKFFSRRNPIQTNRFPLAQPNRHTFFARPPR